jgi:hypothetical protein
MVFTFLHACFRPARTAHGVRGCQENGEQAIDTWGRPVVDLETIGRGEWLLRAPVRAPGGAGWAVEEEALCGVMC